MYTLMEDPVILPSSKVTIDRATIRSHLLSDPNDPFNRAPLKIEEVIPSKSDNPHQFETVLLTGFNVDTDLKKQIEDFKAERKAAKLQSMKQDVMDTSTD
jgi:ubiquitin conjugation factor E4 B